MGSFNSELEYRIPRYSPEDSQKFPGVLGDFCKKKTNFPQISVETGACTPYVSTLCLLSLLSVSSLSLRVLVCGASSARHVKGADRRACQAPPNGSLLLRMCNFRARRVRKANSQCLTRSRLCRDNYIYIYIYIYIHTHTHTYTYNDVFMQGSLCRRGKCTRLPRSARESLKESISEHQRVSETSSLEWRRLPGGCSAYVHRDLEAPC